MKIHSAKHYRGYKIDAATGGLHMRNIDKRTVESSTTSSAESPLFNSWGRDSVIGLLFHSAEGKRFTWRARCKRRLANISSSVLISYGFALGEDMALGEVR